MPAAEITFQDGGRTLYTDMDLELLIRSPQADDFLARQKPSREQGPVELDKADRPVSPPRETLEDHDIEEPGPDEDDFCFSP